MTAVSTEAALTVGVINFGLAELEKEMHDLVDELRCVPDPTSPQHDVELVPQLLMVGTRLDGLLAQLQNALMDFRGHRRREAVMHPPVPSEDIP